MKNTKQTFRDSVKYTYIDGLYYSFGKFSLLYVWHFKFLFYFLYNSNDKQISFDLEELCMNVMHFTTNVC